MHTSRAFAIVLGTALLLSGDHVILAQPLLQEGENQAEEPVEPTAEAQRRELAHRRAQFEEEQQLKLQKELMRMGGERLRAEQEEMRRRDVMMRYALIIAVAVIATTLLIAFARSRVGGAGKETGER